MVSVNKILSLGALHGFQPSERLGFVGMNRITAENVEQRLDIFQWSNPAVADRDGIPRAYLVICLSLTGGLEDSGRWRLPLVEWPSERQETRPWEDVVEEFNEIVSPLLLVPWAVSKIPESYRLI